MYILLAILTALATASQTTISFLHLTAHIRLLSCKSSLANRQLRYQISRVIFPVWQHLSVWYPTSLLPKWHLLSRGLRGDVVTDFFSDMLDIINMSCCSCTQFLLWMFTAINVLSVFIGVQMLRKSHNNNNYKQLLVGSCNLLSMRKLNISSINHFTPKRQ